MDEVTVKEIVSNVLSGDPEATRQTVDKYWHPNARLVFGPFFRLDGADNVRAFYRAISVLLSLKPVVHAIYFSRNGDFVIEVTITIALRWLPLPRLLNFVYVSGKVTDYNGRKVILEQYDQLSLVLAPIITIQAAEWIHDVLFLPAIGALVAFFSWIIDTVAGWLSSSVLSSVPPEWRDSANDIMKRVDNFNTWWFEQYTISAVGPGYANRQARRTWRKDVVEGGSKQMY